MWIVRSVEPDVVTVVQATLPVIVVTPAEKVQVVPAVIVAAFRFPDDDIESVVAGLIACPVASSVPVPLTVTEVEVVATVPEEVTLPDESVREVALIPDDPIVVVAPELANDPVPEKPFNAIVPPENDVDVPVSVLLLQFIVPFVTVNELVIVMSPPQLNIPPPGNNDLGANAAAVVTVPAVNVTSRVEE